MKDAIMLRKVHDVQPRTRSRREDLVERYFKEIDAYPLLRPEEERELARRVHDDSCELAALEKALGQDLLDPETYAERRGACERDLREAKDLLIRSNLRLVVTYAFKYENRGLPLPDLISEGNIGLLRAVELFDYSRGCRFSTYGVWWIRQAILKALADKGRLVRIPIHMQRKASRFLKVEAGLVQELGRTPGKDDLSAHFGKSAPEIEGILAMAQEANSLDEELHVEDGDSFLDLLPDERCVDPALDLFRTEAIKVIGNSMSGLTAREAHVLKLRFGLGGEDERTLEYVGERLGITRERARQIQKLACEKLRRQDGLRLLHEAVELAE